MPQPRFAFELTVPGTPEEVWERLWDLERHTWAIPLTRVGGGPLTAGSTFTARTAFGPVGFDDEMVVQEWEPPHRVVIAKVGRVLTGWIEVTLAPASSGAGGGAGAGAERVDARAGRVGAEATRVRWRQVYGARGIPDLLAAPLSPVVRTGYRSAVRKIAGPDQLRR